MARNDISRFHGVVTPCTCGIYEHPEKMGQYSCKLCFGRGFVAACTNCDGKGQIQEKMAGGPGMMKSTCNCCGGQGSFGVNKPADWVKPVKEEATVLTE
jgi:RecJ-like exonuclease